jgi:hypothetical protein
MIEVLQNLQEEAIKNVDNNRFDAIVIAATLPPAKFHLTMLEMN